MLTDSPAILHHKYSLDDGHVAQQINKVDGYKGIMITDNPSEYVEQSPFTSVFSLKAMKRNPSLLKKNNVVGVHVNHGSLAPKFQFLKEQYNIPLFVSFRGKDATAYPKKEKNLARLKKLFATADLFLPVCEHLKQEIVKLGCPEHKIRVLYGGTDLNRFNYKPRKLENKETVRFLAIGRFVEKKGFSTLIHAFANVIKQHKKVELQLIGSGPCEAEYRKLIKKYRLEKNVQILSWVDYRKIQKKYYSSHIFCAPSCTDKEGNQEGIPNTLKEAMATGMPVISTIHAGIPELVTHKESGLLVPEGSVDDLAKAMNWLIKNPNEWERLGGTARKKIETDFNLAIQLKTQKKYYDEVILNQAKNKNDNPLYLADDKQQ